MGQKQTIEVRYDTSRMSTKHPEYRHYVVELKGKVSRTYYLDNTDEVRPLMVPWGEFILDKRIPADIVPQRYV